MNVFLTHMDENYEVQMISRNVFTKQGKNKISSYVPHRLLLYFNNKGIQEGTKQKQHFRN